MKAKTISAILSKRFESFCASIEDEATRKLVEQNTIITGGCIVSLLCNENVSDFDMYFKTPETALAVAKYYVAKLLENPPPCFKGDEKHTVKIWAEMDEASKRVRIVVKSAGVAGENQQDDYQYFEGIQDDETAAREADDYVSKAVQKQGEANVESLDEEPAAKLDDGVKDGKKYRPLFVTSNAITLANKVQLIIRFTGEPDEIHKNYDFVHCTSYWTSWDKKITLRPDALESIITRELRYVGSRYPICSVIRTRKFIKRGWTINAGQFVKMAWQIGELDLKDVAVLEDQLVGVDAAYFLQVIAILKKAPDPQKIDGTYLMTVIDKLF